VLVVRAFIGSRLGRAFWFESRLLGEDRLGGRTEEQRQHRSQREH
jgi:hypothetical protein